MSVPESSGGFEAYRADLEKAERRWPVKSSPAQGLWWSRFWCSFCWCRSSRRTPVVLARIDVLMGDDKALSVGIALPSRLFAWLAMVSESGFRCSHCSRGGGLWRGSH